MQRNAKQCNAKQCIAMQSNATQCKTVQSNAKQCKAMQSNAKQSKAVQSSAKQCKAMQTNAKQCKPMQSNAKHSKAKQKKKRCNAMQSKAEQCNAKLALPFAIRTKTWLGSRWDNVYIYCFLLFCCFEICCRRQAPFSNSISFKQIEKHDKSWNIFQTLQIHRFIPQWGFALRSSYFSNRIGGLDWELARPGSLGNPEEPWLALHNCL